jgi:hypothetical protein
MKATEILDQIIFVGGPPRSGTTFAAKSLNFHPAFVAAIDDHVYECWGLYYNRDRVGLVQELRSRQLRPEEAQEILKNHLFADGRLVGAATSDKIKSFPQVSTSASLGFGAVRSILDNDLKRHLIPLEQFSSKWRLCLKSPEISFVLPQLACHFPGTKFVLVYRPIVEIAESMYRIGNRVKRFPVFHKRWIDETNETGEMIPPPGVPTEWNKLWQTASDFQHCVIYAASYMRGLLEGISALAPGRYFVYNHAHLRKSPRTIFQQLAQFFGLDLSGFHASIKQVQINVPVVQPQQMREYSEIEAELNLNPLLKTIESLAISIDTPSGMGSR